MAPMQFTIDTLLDALSSNPDRPVLFTQNGNTISPGYHVTEVKVSTVNSLDCGQGTDQWRELVIQLLDGNPMSSQAYMPSTKLLGILNQALSKTTSDENTQLYFEFAPANAALLKSSIAAIELVDSTITIALDATTAACKPFQRALANGTMSRSGNGCCGSAPTSSQSCCDSSGDNAAESCCS